MDDKLFTLLVNEQIKMQNDRNHPIAEFMRLYDYYIHSVILPKTGNIRAGVAVNAGWLPAVEEAIDSIKEVEALNPGFHVQFNQIKEKFGGLRMYVSCWSDGAPTNEYGEPTVSVQHEKARADVREKINLAEIKCEEVCDICGKPGTNGTHLSYSSTINATRCEEHRK